MGNVLSAKVYFKNDGQSFINCTRLIFNYNSLRDMTNLCLLFGIIELFIDHCIPKIKKKINSA